MKRLSATCLSFVLLASCATPLPPSGGPPDDIPPEIAESDPPPDAVNVALESIRITFSEYVDESSFAQAFSLTPAPATPPELSWSGRGVEIRLPEGFRDNTTYVVTLDTELRDAHGVSLRAPITFAFSTGPEISAGTLAGRVVQPATRAPAVNVDVFAYALSDSLAPDSLPVHPSYRTQTDTSGAFEFEYLTEQFYFVAALNDANRNLAPDPAESFAAPPIPAVYADSTTVEPDIPWVLARLDTTAPSPVSVESMSSSRHALRLSEPVRFSDRTASSWELVDSASGQAVDVLQLYMREDPRQVHFITPALEDGEFTLRPAALVDTSGNALLRVPLQFTPSASEDTVRLRFQGFLPSDTSVATRVLPRGVEPGLRFNEPPDDVRLAAAVRIVDSTGTPLAFSAVTKDGTTYELAPEPKLRAAGRVEVRVDGSELADTDSVYSATYNRLPQSQSGELGGIADSHVRPVVVEAYPLEIESDIQAPRYAVRADSTGAFVFAGMPAGMYRIRAFADPNEDGIWNPGTLEPYRPAEPVQWVAEPQRVRARWETSLPDTLRIPAP